MERIFCLIEKVKLQFGLYIGRKSVRKLCTFIAGYECAIMDLTGVRIRFDALFQNYVDNMLGPSHSERHWDERFANDSSDEKAFDVFYRFFDDFKNFYRNGDLSVFLLASTYYFPQDDAMYELLYITKDGTYQHLGQFNSKDSVQNALITHRDEEEYRHNPSAFLIMRKDEDGLREPY